MTRRSLLWLALGATLMACSPGYRGMLEPIAGADVTLVSTNGLPGDTARLRDGGVTADVTGRWSDQGESVHIEYRSEKAPASFAVTATSTWNGLAAPATAAWPPTPAPGNAIGRPLLDAGPLRIAAKAKKRIQIGFARTDGPSIGDEVTIRIPMPGGVRTARFRVAGE